MKGTRGDTRHAEACGNPPWLEASHHRPGWWGQGVSGAGVEATAWRPPGSSDRAEAPHSPVAVSWGRPAPVLPTMTPPDQASLWGSDSGSGPMGLPAWWESEWPPDSGSGSGWAMPMGWGLARDSVSESRRA